MKSPFAVVCPAILLCTIMAAAAQPVRAGPVYVSDFVNQSYRAQYTGACAGTPIEDTFTQPGAYSSPACPGVSAHMVTGGAGLGFNLEATTTKDLNSGNYVIAQAGSEFEDAGVIHVAGGGTTTVSLVDVIRNTLSGAPPSTLDGALASIDVQWGPYNSTTGVAQIDNQAIISYIWSTYPWQASPSCAYEGTCCEHTACLSLNSNQSVNASIIVSDGDALLFDVSGDVYSAADGTDITLSDPLTLQLQEGTTFESLNLSGPQLPVTYDSATTVPEPSTSILLGSGLLLMVGLGWRRRRAA